MSGRAKNGRFAKKEEAKRRSIVAEKRKSSVGKRRKAETEVVVEAGRRILDLDILANLMWCKVCNKPLHFKYMEKEVRRGLASIFHFRCPECLEDNHVCSSHVTKNSELAGYPVYIVNCKAALGCLDSGCGHEQFNRLLTGMNIPPVSHHTLKLAEEKVGLALESTAQESCRAALLEDKSLTIQNNAEEVGQNNNLSLYHVILHRHGYSIRVLTSEDRSSVLRDHNKY